ncbi:hypothetical protein GCM10011371_20370 [Novosphingobium marinum]|nr:hypothetical protein GCM10011371_20370 [Novosphingobium marinum]
MYPMHKRASPGTGAAMHHIDILLTREPEGGIAPFEHGEMQLVFHMWDSLAELPLLEGSLWAFVDWVLPDISGLELVRRLRSDPLTAQAHITMILEEDDAEDKRRALRTGADDYMIGPIDRTALLDRVLSVKVLDREPGSALKAVRHGDLTIDLAAFQARWQDKPISLMPNEFRLLRYFAEHPGRVFTRAQLIAALGKQEPPVDERTVDVWIGRLRRALRSAGAGNPLRTVRSLGYVFDQVAEARSDVA